MQSNLMAVSRPMDAAMVAKGNAIFVHTPFSSDMGFEIRLTEVFVSE